MTRVFKPASAEEDHAFLASHCNRCTRSLEKSCDILEAAEAHEDTDPDYPDEWILQDDGRPTCTAFAARDGGMRPEPNGCEDYARPEPVSADAAERPVVASIASDIIGKGVVEALWLRRGKRSWTVPFAQVSELFEHAPAMSKVLNVPAPHTARVHRAKAHITIVARSSRGGSSITSTVRLKLRRAS